MTEVWLWILKWGVAGVLVLVFLFFATAMVAGVVDSFKKKNREGE